MKKITTLVLLFMATAGNVFSQNDTIWRTGGLFAVNFNQVNLSNWAGGGQNSVALNGLANLFANYKKGKITWDNNLDMGYGIVKQGEEQIRKNDDRLELNTKLGYDAYKSKFFYTVLFNFRSQFAPGFNYPRTDSSRYISKFAAPAFSLLAVGIDYKYKDFFSFFVSPITARVVIVNDDSLSDAGAFGVKPGEKIRQELGAYINTRFQKDVMKNVNFMTKLDLFSNYKEDPQNIDVNWEILLTVKVNKYITASIGTQLIYDDNTAIQLFKESNGIRTPVLRPDGTQKTGPRTQFRQVFGIGFAYKMSGYSIK